MAMDQGNEIVKLQKEINELRDFNNMKLLYSQNQNSMSSDYSRNMRSYINDSQAQRPSPIIFINQSRSKSKNKNSQRGENPLMGISSASLHSNKINSSKNTVNIRKKGNDKRSIRFEESPIRSSGNYYKKKTVNSNSTAYGKAYSVDRSINLDQFKINPNEKKNSSNYKEMNKMDKNFFWDKSNRSKSPDFSNFKLNSECNSPLYLNNEMNPPKNSFNKLSAIEPNKRNSNSNFLCNTPTTEGQKDSSNIDQFGILSLNEPTTKPNKEIPHNLKPYEKEAFIMKFEYSKVIRKLKGGEKQNINESTDKGLSTTNLANFYSYSRDSILLKDFNKKCICFLLTPRVMTLIKDEGSIDCIFYLTPTDSCFYYGREGYDFKWHNINSTDNNWKSFNLLNLKQVDFVKDTFNKFTISYYDYVEGEEYEAPEEKNITIETPNREMCDDYVKCFRHLNRKVR